MSDEPIYSALDDKSPTVPNAPTNVVGIPSSTQVALTWTASSYDGGLAITAYNISWSEGNGGVDYVGGGTTSYTALGLTNGTSYTFRVRAANSLGFGSYSAYSSAVTPAAVPTAPNSVTGTLGNGEVSLTWNAGNSNGSAITNYTVEYTPSGGSPSTVSTNSTSTSYTVTGLTNGTSYTFKVKATNSIGDSVYSTASDAVTPKTTPGAPTNVVGTPSSTQVVVTWTAPASNGGGAITGYQIVWTDGGGGSDYVGGGTTSYTATGLTNGTSYTFTVRASNNPNTFTPASPFSDPSSAVTPAAVPTAPNSVTGTLGNGEVSLTWNAGNSNGSAITNYTVEYTPSGGSPSTVSTNSTSTSYTVTGLTNGTSYTFKVKATNSIGDSVYSTASDAVTPATTPDAPTNVIGTFGNSQVSLSWTAPASNGGSSVFDYVIQYNDGSSWQTFSDDFSSATSTIVTSLNNGTSYTFRVLASNSVGYSQASASSAAVTPMTTPSAPYSVSGTRGNTTVSLTWSASYNGGSAITNHTVEYTPSGGSAVEVVTGSASSSYTVTGLTNGISYTFRVKATNSLGYSQYSTASDAAIPMTIPGAPTSLTATNNGTTGVITLGWTAPADFGGDVSLYYYPQLSSDSGVTWTNTDPSYTTGTTAEYGPYTFGTTYIFRVRAANQVGYGSYSTSSNSVLNSVKPYNAGISSVTRGNAQVSLTWYANDGGSAITDYNIQHSIDNGANWITFTDGVSPAESGTVTGLTNGTSYVFRIRAENLNGLSPYSDASSAIVPATAPGAPTGVSGVGISNAVEVSWTAPADLGGNSPYLIYYVEYSSDNGSSWTPSGGSTTSNSSSVMVTVGGLTNGTSYRFKVRAFGVGADTYGAYSNLSSAVTPN